MASRDEVDTAVQKAFEAVVAVLHARARIDVVLLVGSYARGEQKPSSDIDFVILSPDTKELIARHEWTEIVGPARKVVLEDWGAIQSVRVFYDQCEIEYGLGDPSWLALPLDAGTESVLRDGYRVLYDRKAVMPNVAAFLDQG